MEKKKKSKNKKKDKRTLYCVTIHSSTKLLNNN